MTYKSQELLPCYWRGMDVFRSKAHPRNIGKTRTSTKPPNSSSNSQDVGALSATRPACQNHPELLAVYVAVIWHFDYEETNAQAPCDSDASTKPNQSNRPVQETHKVRRYLPTFVATPTSLVNQWIVEVADFFPFFQIIVSYDEGLGAGTSRPDIEKISSTAMKHFPDTIRGKSFPKDIRYIVDKKDPRALSVLFITSYDTHSSRAIKMTRKTKKNGKIQKKYHTKWAKRFGIAIADEAPRLKNMGTKTHIGFSEMEFRSESLDGGAPSRRERCLVPLLPNG